MLIQLDVVAEKLIREMSGNRLGLLFDLKAEWSLKYGHLKIDPASELPL